MCASGRYAKYISLLPSAGTMVITAESVARTLPWVIITPYKKLRYMSVQQKRYNYRNCTSLFI